MKNRLLLSLLMGGASLAASAQYTIVKDLTSTIANADFSEGTPVTETIRTYDYDMADEGAGSGEEGAVGLFGQQVIPGWTALNPSDNKKVMHSNTDPAREDGANARAAGLFAYEDDANPDAETIGLGGNYFAPYIAEGQTGYALGLVTVWGGDLRYEQDMSLDAGAYMLLIKYWNSAGTGEVTSRFGFFVNDGPSYVSSTTSYPVNEWLTDTVVFRLEEPVAGKLSLGFSFGAGSGSAPHLFIDNVKLYSIDEQGLIQEEIDKAKEELLNLIEMGELYGVDVSASMAVYNNPKATLEDVQAAIENQQKINETGITDLSEFFIQNPHFSEDEPLVGGICTYDYDCEKNNIPLTNFSMLPVSGWDRTKTDNGCASGVYAIGSGAFLGGKDYVVPTTMSDGSTEGKVLGFVTCWTMAVQYKQAVTLPAGKYTLSMSYFNTGGTQAIDKNLIGFVADDGTEYLATMKSFPVGKWTTEEVSFELDEQTTGYFSLGYKSVNTGSGNMPHFFTDGISLVYVGSGLNVSLFALKSAVSGAEEYLDYEFNTELTKQLEAALKTANDLIDADSEDADANKAATNAIKDLMPAVKASIAAYEDLEAFSDEGGPLPTAQAKYAEYETLSERLGELSDDIMDALDKRTWTTAQIEEAIASLDVIIKEEIQKIWDEALASGEELDEDLDITPIFDQMSYTFSTSTAQGSSVPDKEWQFGNASNFKTQYGTAEVWNQSPFEVKRTLKDLPAGKYTISTKAFFRTADNATNYENYVEGTESAAKLFAGRATADLTNVAALASNTTAEGWTETSEESGIFVPNSQFAAYNIFENAKYDGLTQKSVSIALAEPGDITFGIKADQMEGNSWVIWYGFTIAYNAATDDLYDEEILALLDDAAALQETGCGDVQKALSGLEDAIGDGEEALEGSTDDKVAAIKSLNAAIEYASKSEGLVEQLTNLRSLYESLLEELNKSDIIVAYMEQIDEGLDSNEQVQEYIDGMPAAWVASVFDGLNLASASEENPIDVTTAILNPDFETGDTTGWTYNTLATGDTGVRENSNDTYHIENASGSYVFNTWNGSVPDGGYYVSQVLPGLPAGKYKLEALLASDLANKITLSAGSASVTFEMANEKNMGEDDVIVFNLFQAQDVEVKVASNTWFKADNFRLSYIGSANISVEDITNLIDEYLTEGSTITIQDITDLIDMYLAQ
ncbi:MAG: hypothetical protein IJ901_03845 [Bacteroidaceae bacterium]|nr:hypothetical protein [Bacteroidaceae bacterium]